MKSLTQIYSEAKADTTKNLYMSLEEKLRKEIANDKYVKMFYEDKCDSNCDYGMHGFIMAIVSFVLACFAIMADKADCEVGVFFIAILYVVIISVYGVYTVLLAEKYRKIKKILDNIK